MEIYCVTQDTVGRNKVSTQFVFSHLHGTPCALALNRQRIAKCMHRQSQSQTGPYSFGVPEKLLSSHYNLSGGWSTLRRLYCQGWFLSLIKTSLISTESIKCYSKNTRIAEKGSEGVNQPKQTRWKYGCLIKNYRVLQVNHYR
jgi:hypothetical protein